MANPEHVEIFKKGAEEWNSWREEHPDVKPDLHDAKPRGANLRGANLRGTNINGAHLKWANLKGADLRYAYLKGANLREANLIEADLRGALLVKADLCKARLNSADLSGAHLVANLNEAYLSEANFHKASVYSTSFGKVDLSDAKGLNTILHTGPSTISIDTIFLSKGKIPEVFLRGVGVPENLINYLPSFLNQAIEYYSCFISYNRENKSFARRLHDSLQGKGIRCWLDDHQILPGEDIYEQIDRGIRLWDKVLLCCSEMSLKSWWVDNEINKAFKKEQQLMKQRGRKVWSLIPLNLDDYLFSDQWENGKKDEILSRLAADFTGWETDNKRFEDQFEIVLKALRTDEGGRDVPPESRL